MLYATCLKRILQLLSSFRKCFLHAGTHRLISKDNGLPPRDKYIQQCDKLDEWLHVAVGLVFTVDHNGRMKVYDVDEEK